MPSPMLYTTPRKKIYEPPADQKPTPVHGCPEEEKNKVSPEEMRKAVKHRKKSNVVSITKVHLSKEEDNRRVRTASKFRAGDGKEEEVESCSYEDQVVPKEAKPAKFEEEEAANAGNSEEETCE